LHGTRGDDSSDAPIEEAFLTTALHATTALTATLIALAGMGSAVAEISVTRAEYAGGVLVVRGETSRSNQKVTLDGRYSTRTNPNKEFRFRIRYLPSDCGFTIRAGREMRPAQVANCDVVGVTPGIGLAPSEGAAKGQVPVPPAAQQVVPLRAQSMYQGWRASRVLGNPVVTRAGDHLGALRNILMGADGRILALIVEGASSANEPEFVFRIPWTLFGPEFPHRIIADVSVDPFGERGLFAIDQDRGSRSVNEFAVTAVVGDYARLQPGQAYGYVSDVVFSDGQLLAVLVTRDRASGGGTYAFGFPGTIGQWNPAAGYYGLPYVTPQQANGAAVKVDPKRFADPS
jgi:hypothetical protein